MLRLSKNKTKIAATKIAGIEAIMKSLNKIYFLYSRYKIIKATTISNKTIFCRNKAEKQKDKNETTKLLKSKLFM
jgi:hypothetical protein